MKKIILVILAIVLIITTGIYIIIPSSLKITSQVVIDASDVIASKFLIRENGWDKWWPGTKLNDNRFSFNKLQFDIDKITNSAVDLSFQQNGLKFGSSITYMSSADGMVRITWYAQTKSSNNPVQRIADYMEARHIEEQNTRILLHLKSFLENIKNAYGYNIYISKVKDPVLLTSTTTFNSYPDMRHIYKIIQGLREQAKTQGALETNFPMLNVNVNDEKQFETSLAIPINKVINTTGNSFINQMVPGGNLLVADVNGGPNTIKDAFAQVKVFMKDHRLISPAMPFESLITDRLAEPDTSKWKTKIYYPIF